MLTRTGNPPRTMPRTRTILAYLLLFALPATIAAQSLELPVLAVDHQHRPVDEVHLDQLKIKAGSAAPISPTALRKEGSDPISLAILIDASRDSWHDLKQLGNDPKTPGSPEPHTPSRSPKRS